ncbi:nucleoside triphosphate pyrophosphohydrolase [Aurantivibrio plasticivorans]
MSSAITRLIELMSRLRDPETGCPWDLKQNYKTIAPSTIEEAYEVVDAIERESYSELQEELGDLLFQVVFYAQLGQEEGRFDFEDIASSITAKLLRRHPHVFPDGTLESRVDGNEGIDETQVKKQWEQIKQQERHQKGKCGLLDDVPVGMPALSRAVKLQKRASQVGFDWNDVDQVFLKLDEEVQELKQAITSDDQLAITDELGDVLFVAANLARHLKVDPELAARQANQKFERRFGYMESTVSGRGEEMGDVPLEQLENLWQEAKILEKSQ